jgi:anti-anti-sigma factor
MPSEKTEVADGTLLVRTEKDGETEVIALCGELDLANAGTAEAALEGSLAAGRSIVVDMRELEFIDSTGIAVLVATLNGDDGESRIRFIPSSAPAVSRVLELTGLAERMPLADA